MTAKVHFCRARGEKCTDVVGLHKKDGIMGLCFTFFTLKIKAQRNLHIWKKKISPPIWQSLCLVTDTSLISFVNESSGNHKQSLGVEQKLWAHTLKEGVWSLMSACPLAASPGESA